MGASHVLAQVRRGALLTEGSRALAMISGGRDSTCLLDVAVSLLGARSVAALHVNYQLRASAPGDEQRCRELCGELGADPLPIRRMNPAEPFFRIGPDFVIRITEHAGPARRKIHFVCA